MTADEAVARLLDSADLFHVGGAVWMLAPVTSPMIDALVTVGARAEDMEPEPVESDGDDQDYTVAV